MSRPNLSWLLDGAECRECNYDIVVTQGKECDYRYYCSNPDCQHHLNPHDLCDQADPPDFVVKCEPEKRIMADFLTAHACLCGGARALTGVVQYTGPLRWEFACASCGSKGHVGYGDLGNKEPRLV